MLIPESHADLLDKKAFAHLATVMKDGSPQVSPVWVLQRDGHVVVNTAVGRLKDKNLRRDPRVGLSVTDPDNPYRCLMIRGRVVSRETEGADAEVDALAGKYMGVDTYPYRGPEEVRVSYTIAIDRVTAMG